MESPGNIKYGRGQNPNSRNGYKKGHTVWLGRNLTDAHKEKLRISKLGKKNPMFGKTPSEETNKKRSLSLIGKRHTEETKKTIGEKNRIRILALNIRPQRYCNDCSKKITFTNKYPYCNKCRGKHFRGKDNKNYIDGGEESRKIRWSTDYKEWRIAVFKRDNWTCQWCGAKTKKGIKIKFNADHIKPFCAYPELRLDLNNGRTLCEDCHKKTDTWGITRNKYTNIK